ncbi:MAG: hypothetical protein HQL82_09695 [Magnetococcales bacterium]|nr:hypothetical protein [Magnetococcales bacterium]
MSSLWFVPAAGSIACPERLPLLSSGSPCINEMAGVAYASTLIQMYFAIPQPNDLLLTLLLPEKNPHLIAQFHAMCPPDSHPTAPRVNDLEKWITFMEGIAVDCERLIQIPR